MKIVICGDAHIGAIFQMGGPNKSGGNTRIDDYERTLNYIVDYAIKNEVSAFIQTGDAFDSRTPAPEHMNILSQALKRLSMANIISVVIMGNHDYRRNGDSFTSAISSLAAKDYSNVRIVLEPEILKLTTKEYGDANLVLIPYRDRRMYGGKTTFEDSELYKKEISELIDTCDTSIPTIAVGHNFFFNGSYNDYGGAEILAHTDTFKKCDLIAMGHYHQFKIINKRQPIAIYTGSMEKLNFGDEKIDKYFLDYNTSSKQMKVLKCPTRNLADLSLDLSTLVHDDFYDNFKGSILNLQLEDKIVRLKILVKDSLLSFIKKNDLEKILYDKGAFYVSKIITEPVFTRVIRDDAILKHKDDFSMFKAFLENQEDLSKEELDIILEESKKNDYIRIHNDSSNTRA